MNNKYDADLSFSNKNKKGRKAEDAFIQEDDLQPEVVLVEEELVQEEQSVVAVEETVEQPKEKEEVKQEEAAPSPKEEERVYRTVVSMYDITPEGQHISAQDMKMRRVLVERPRLNRRLKGGR